MKTRALSLLIGCGLWFGFLHQIKAQPYVWTTIAGSTNCASVDGTNTGALFRYPSGIALDAAHNCYVVDSDANTVRRLHPIGTNWVVTTIAGLAGAAGAADGTNSTARFNNPISIAADSQGVLYVTESLNNAIRMISPMGTNWVVSTVAGGGYQGSYDGTNRSATFAIPEGIAADSSGTLFVTDFNNHTIRRITPMEADWVVTTVAGMPRHYGSANGTNSDARFNFPAGITVDNAGNLLVTGMEDRMVRQIAHEGTNWVVTTLAGVANSSGSADGTNSEAKFVSPTGVAVDRANHVFVVDQYGCTIRKIMRSGTNVVVTTVGGVPYSVGNADGVDSNARFNLPYGIAVDDAGNLFAADTSGHTIRMGRPLALHVAAAANQMILSWPALATNFVAEVTASPEPGATWTPLTNEVNIVGTSCIVTHTTQTSAAFYRLRMQ